MILDQRHLSGEHKLDEPGQVEMFWRDHAVKMMAQWGYMFVNRRDATDFRTSGRKLPAYLNHARWCADCLSDDCNGGIALWKDNPRACCLDCGTIYTNIVWPDDKAFVNITAIAALIPMPEMINWRPEEESADDAFERLREVAIL